MSDEHKNTGRKPEPQEQVNKRHADLKQRREAAGLKRCEVWAKPEHHAAIKEFARSLDTVQKPM